MAASTSNHSFWPKEYRESFDGGASPSFRNDTTSDVMPSLLTTGTPRRAPARFPPIPCTWMAHVEDTGPPAVGGNFHAGATPSST
jgi:hypothetical protein